jgi:hypothetical protein
VTEAQRAKLRHDIGMAVLDIQNRNCDRFSPDVLIPEIVAALMSLSAFFAHQAGAIEREQFEDLCEEVVADEWRFSYDVGASPG